MLGNTTFIICILVMFGFAIVGISQDTKSNTLAGIGYGLLTIAGIITFNTISLGNIT